MRVVVHIGPNKTGTTAIQKTLARSRSKLLEQGVLYPRTCDDASHHNIFVAGAQARKAIPRLLKHRFENAREDRHDVFDTEKRYLHEQIAQSRPHTVVISGESLMREMADLGEDFWERLFDCRSEAFTFVSYVRDPAERFLSIAQQRLKHSSRFNSEALFHKMSPFLQSFEGRFPGQNVVRPFESGLRAEADIVVDFLQVVSPDLRFDAVQKKSANETLSGEAMKVLQDYRQRFHAGANGKPKADVEALLRLFGELDEAGSGAARPALRADVRATVYQENKSDIEWLAHRYGNNIERMLERMPQDTAKPVELAKLRDVSDLCELDFERIHEIYARCVHKLLKNNWKTKQQQRA